MAGEQDVIQLPFKVTEINEDMLVALHRNFKEIERHLSFLQMQVKFATGGGVANLKDSAKVWDRAENITETGTFLTEKLEGLIEELQIADAAISELKLKDLAVNSAKLAENAVIMEKIADGAVDTDKLAANAVVAEKINANAVTSEKIHAGAVTTEKIGAKAVTAEKINVESLSAISSDIGHITAGQIDAGVIRVGANTQFEAGYDPTKVASMGVDVDCVGLWHFDGSLNSHKGVAAESNADYNTGLFGQALNIATGKHLKVPTAGLSAGQGTINFRAKNLAASANGSVLIDLPDSTNTEGLRVGISGDGKIYAEMVTGGAEPDDFSQTETDFSTGTLTQVWQAEGGLQLADTTIRTWNDFTGESWNDLA